MAILANLSHGLISQNEADIGSGFYRIQVDGTKPEDAGDGPTIADFREVAGRSPIIGDLVIVTYSMPNTTGDYSCAFERRIVNMVPAWVVAAEFVDGNLVVAGSVFSNVGLSAGISIGDLQRILGWDGIGDTSPDLIPGQAFSGGYMGFAENTQAGSMVTQEILLVGDETDHLFWNGETLTLSGVTIEDPTILVTPTAPVLNTGNPVQVGDVVSFNDRIYRAIANQPMTPTTPPPDDTLWEDITEDIPRGPVVTVATASPAEATQGDLWYDETIGRMFMFINATDPVSMNVIGTWADVTKN